MNIYYSILSHIIIPILSHIIPYWPYINQVFPLTNHQLEAQASACTAVPAAPSSWPRWSLPAGRPACRRNLGKRGGKNEKIVVLWWVLIGFQWKNSGFMVVFNGKKVVLWWFSMDKWWFYGGFMGEKLVVICFQWVGVKKHVVVWCWFFFCWDFSARNMLGHWCPFPIGWLMNRGVCLLTPNYKR